MRRLTVDSGNDVDDYVVHSRPSSSRRATTAAAATLTPRRGYAAIPATDRNQNGQNGHAGGRTTNSYNNKKPFKSKLSDISDVAVKPFQGSASAPPPFTLSRHRRRLKMGRRRQHPFECRCWNALLSKISAIIIKSSSSSSSSSSGMPSLALAVGLWYTLGVVSIATSKIILLPSSNKTSSDDDGEDRHMHMSPLTLTLQQFWIGSTLLKVLLQWRNSPSSTTSTPTTAAGLQPWPPPVVGSLTPNAENDKPRHHTSTNNTTTAQQILLLRYTAICFALGFLATNFAFAGSAASFVETVKAAEPLTSATVAVAYGLESLTLPQKTSLGTIVAGVLLATLGDRSTGSRDNHHTDDRSHNPYGTLVATLLPSVIVMTSNLCFSFRGLYQKLLRNVASTQVLDDWNLQYRMQCTGVWILIGPVLLLDVLPTSMFGLSSPWSTRLPDSGRNLLHYMVLAIINGVAFCSYNLASTYLLTRLSVVHHAALNCLRRVFAIVVTSLLFGVPLTVTKLTGIGLAVLGFWSYTHYKMMAQQQQHPPPPPDDDHEQQHSFLPLSGIYHPV